MGDEPRGHAAHQERRRHLSAIRLERRAGLIRCRWCSRLIPQRAVLRTGHFCARSGLAYLCYVHPNSMTVNHSFTLFHSLENFQCAAP